ncbi:NAD(P)H-dependent oxidoreductase [Candidatus Peregrinibacteria bacterium]|jgi:NAD(P)H dehydrogenase (quinone)|nr:NAD(P)H-dependent oxidoreductase [Candidatus Peregrinibacteria bacterium]MBT4147688.1 NAD(P)H-dependent oxidoreductase [Candidatus Peregrinibacteria bacterium]MBT4365967.1 NAD(P)H-dependent oxidoreductase [Candidatus Peregrinibacteria bacterium]MBT4455816.1 NAD(P)H-dependent oxidoreductase [Candidatus Peregrinibacteria bacterium]
MKTLLILGHPLKDSFCAALGESYLKGAKAKGHETKTIYLGDLKFNPLLENAYKKEQPLEPDLQEAQKLISWADHIVFSYPVWWSLFPALLKGFFDRVLLPDFAFKFIGGGKWKKLLKGKTARLLITMDSPPPLHILYFRNPSVKAMKATIGFCGIKQKNTYFGSIRYSDDKKKKKWLKKAERLGRKL